MDSDLFFKVFSGSCADSSYPNDPEPMKRLTTGKGLISRVCGGGRGFDYQLPDWSTTRTFDPSGGMCVAMYDADWGEDDYLCQVDVSPVISEGSFDFDCMWDSDHVDFTMSYELVPK